MLKNAAHIFLKKIGRSETFFKSSSRNRLTAFLFHDVCTTPSEFSKKYHLSMTPEEFEQKIKLIKSHYDLIAPDELLGDKLPERPAIITFDDGWKNTFEIAVPILESLDAPAILFLNMAPITRRAHFYAGITSYLFRNDPNFRAQVIPSQYHNHVEGHIFARPKDVEAYTRHLSSDLFDSIFRGMGAFSSEEDVTKISKSHRIFLGSHLFNHYNAALLSEEELVEAEKNNRQELIRLASSRVLPFVSYPHGQPVTCYNEKTNQTLYSLGVKVIFSAYPIANKMGTQSFYHRIGVTGEMENITDIKYAASILPFIRRMVSTSNIEFDTGR